MNTLPLLLLVVGGGGDPAATDSPYAFVSWARRADHRCQCYCRCWHDCPPSYSYSYSVPTYSSESVVVTPVPAEVPMPAEIAPAAPVVAESAAKRAEAAWRVKDYDLTAKLYTQAMEEEPEKRELYRRAVANTYSARALSLYRQRSYDAAIADYDRAIEVFPYQPVVYRNRGIAYLAKGLNQELSFAGGAVAPDPEATATEKSNAYRRAVDDLKKVVDMNPKDAQSNYWLAYLLSAGVEGDARRAKDAVEYAAKANELTEYKNWEYLMILATANAQAGNFDEGVRRTQEAADLAPEAQKEKLLTLRQHFEQKLALR